jgi:hypothetical protein
MTITMVDMFLLSIEVLWFTWKTLFRVWPSGLWHYAVLYVDTTVLEEHAASIFRDEGLGPRRCRSH